MQYLVECSDTSFCVVYEKEIIYNPQVPEISIGCAVQFLYSEKANRVAEWDGKVIEISSEYLI